MPGKFTVCLSCIESQPKAWTWNDKLHIHSHCRFCQEPYPIPAGRKGKTRGRGKSQKGDNGNSTKDQDDLGDEDYKKMAEKQKDLIAKMGKMKEALQNGDVEKLAELVNDDDDAAADSTTRKATVGERQKKKKDTAAKAETILKKISQKRQELLEIEKQYVEQRKLADEAERLYDEAIEEDYKAAAEKKGTDRQPEDGIEEILKNADPQQAKELQERLDSYHKARAALDAIKAKIPKRAEPDQEMGDSSREEATKKEVVAGACTGKPGGGKGQEGSEDGAKEEEAKRILEDERANMERKYKETVETEKKKEEEKKAKARADVEAAKLASEAAKLSGASPK